MRSLFLTLLVGVLTACTGAPTDPSQHGVLSLTAQISNPVVSSGNDGVLTFRLANLSRAPVTLAFGSGCQILPYISDLSDQIVHPAGGGWMCTMSLTELVIPGLGAEMLEVRVRTGTSASGPYVVLPPGEYRAYAEVAPASLAPAKLRSSSVSFVVQ